jgi:hypothetical protein
MFPMARAAASRVQEHVRRTGPGPRGRPGGLADPFVVRFRPDAGDYLVSSAATGASGRAGIVVEGKGANLALPDLSSLTAPVTAELHDGTSCWSAMHGLGKGTKRNRGLLRTKADRATEAQA